MGIACFLFYFYISAFSFLPFIVISLSSEGQIKSYACYTWVNMQINDTARNIKLQVFKPVFNYKQSELQGLWVLSIV
jgi:hypothetical protein